ncbi:MAG TPA: LysR family transcriptional regulator [Marinobacter sp.]|nr:LysR family transcriptional regulator [Marinobacter sp.]
MNYQDLFYFIKVAEKGSIVAAADFLKIPTSTLSRRLQALEQDLGYKLVHRSAKKFGLTESGQRFYKSLAGIFNDLELSAENVKSDLAGISGDIRITAPIAAGHFFVKEWVFQFMEENPLVSVDLLFTNEPIDLVANGIDVAFRLGGVTVSDWVIRDLHATELVLVATPDLLSRYPQPADPSQLDDLPLVSLKRQPYWRFHDQDGHSVTYAPKPKLRTDEIQLATDAVRRHLGASWLPRYIVQADLESGAMVSLLDDWVSEKRTIHMLYPNRDQLPNKIRSFVDFVIRKSSELEPPVTPPRPGSH